MEPLVFVLGIAVGITACAVAGLFNISDLQERLDLLRNDVKTTIPQLESENISLRKRVQELEQGERR